ncbi:phosphate ABC transporter ATP-binding protein [Abyssicoccus albus]|uniref:Phosphate ABC transporter ATP-binding protein (PhoT family) n=1 Tax=Abyssicoccus albus TaxID=1817405 RepID=A0A1Q1G2Q2_9BACL|nr:phosphate ABC transporter ATP-binding protein [Abyssicoccus albus]AQL56638.1 hypothetical protein BVH56_06775 [Abyssicoccus albus]RPF57546.1 phosphate ABC transporter ATP-binding protein (PhoT family) [Abyssicoccus albus]
MTIQFLDISFKDVLKNITVEIPTHQITAIVGPSGAGKSTFLKHINRLISPNSGDILIDGQSIESVDILSLRKRVGLAFQSAPMFNGTIYDNLNIPMKIHQQQLDKDRAQSLLDKVDLSHLSIDQSIKNLSGGEKQKLAIARTLVLNPDILLLDEITSSLDVHSVQEIELLIQKLNQEDDKTILWITHNLQQAKRMSHYTIVMEDGEVVEAGPFDTLSHPFVKGEY